MDFKVIIVGGSVAGLSLANMLERSGIDYVVLEARREIAPQLGASIGMLPNGLRILEQLGCYDALAAPTTGIIHTSYIRASSWKVLTSIQQLGTKLIERHGYPMMFIDRRMLLNVLYNNLSKKSKVLVGKQVVGISLTSSRVSVTTKDGDSFSGDILIGADGIHSTVRREMWRHADEIQPGYIPASERTAMPTDYKYIFGTSK